MKKIYIISGVVVALLIIIAVLYFFVPGRMAMSVSSGSAYKEASIQVDNSAASYSLPATIKLNAGKHTVTISPNNKSANISYESVTIWPFLTNSVSITIDQPELSGSRGAADNSYLSAFPYRTADLLLEAQTSADLSQLIGINLTVYHRFGDPVSSPSVYQFEHDNAITEAKKYLIDSKVPSNIPLTIVDD